MDTAQTDTIMPMFMGEPAVAGNGPPASSVPFVDPAPNPPAEQPSVEGSRDGFRNFPPDIRGMPVVQILMKHHASIRFLFEGTCKGAYTMVQRHLEKPAQRTSYLMVRYLFHYSMWRCYLVASIHNRGTCLPDIAGLDPCLGTMFKSFQQWSSRNKRLGLDKPLDATLLCEGLGWPCLRRQLKYGHAVSARPGGCFGGLSIRLSCEGGGLTCGYLVPGLTRPGTAVPQPAHPPHQRDAQPAPTTCTIPNPHPAPPSTAAGNVEPMAMAMRQYCLDQQQLTMMMDFVRMLADRIATLEARLSQAHDNGGYSGPCRFELTDLERSVRHLSDKSTASSSPPHQR